MQDELEDMLEWKKNCYALGSQGANKVSNFSGSLWVKSVCWLIQNQKLSWL
jgi:hypothetical protein